jgi:fumarylacetoacetase
MTLKSWVESANDPAGDFPIQNLPLGVFSREGSQSASRVGVAIGDSILDLRATAATGLLSDLDAHLIAAIRDSSLNGLLALGRPYWRSLRETLTRLLDADEAALRDNAEARTEVLVERSAAVMEMPVTIGDYTDFYASVHHATNVGAMFRPDNPLLPNYKHLPVGYHGRASSVVVSGTPITRPCGQTRGDDTQPPTFWPCRLLDYELEMGFFVGPGNPMGRRVNMADAFDHIAGLVIVNDWSARDVQKWEYQPLGPFNAKNFGTSISPWLVSLEALTPFMVPGPERGDDDPPIIDYLQPQRDMGLDVTVEVELSSATMREQGGTPLAVSRSNLSKLFWTIEQMLVHHTSTGCNLAPGDLMATGTISGETEDMRGCLLERTWRGQNPLDLPDGTQRKFLQDGDEVVIRAYCQRDGVPRIGFGECRGVIQPAAE